MGKSGKASQEFLADRRKAIVEMAMKRRQREFLQAATGPDQPGQINQKLDRMPGAFTLPSVPQPPTSQR